MESEEKFWVLFWSFIGFIVIGLIVLWMAFGPSYKVYRAHKHGEAEYAQAEQNRRIKILEAEAKKQSATLEAEAEVERSKGLAKANEIVSESLKGHEEYLRYLWITHLETGDNKEVIYVPTEANLPILEAGKR
jgi:regulator of protease activity HflC (stomatin/prohibitin superfamily)